MSALWNLRLAYLLVVVLVVLSWHCGAIITSFGLCLVAALVVGWSSYYGVIPK